MNENLPSLDAFIFDLDGVIWRGDTPVEGAVETVQRLREAGKRCLFCTNNARKLPADFAAKLTGMGIEATEEDVMTSAAATAMYLASQYTGDFSAFVVGEEGLVTALRRVGARVVTAMENENIETDSPDFPVDCVVVGIDTRFDYKRMRLAQKQVMNGARFIATNRDATFPVDGGVVPGAGSIVAAIETASGVTPVTVGKPQPLMMTLLMQKFGLNAETTAMIGDRPDTDIVAARRARITAIFVATGVMTMEQGLKMRGEKKPEFFYQTLDELGDAVLGASTREAAIIVPAASSSVATNAAIASATAPEQDPFALPDSVSSAPAPTESIATSAVVAPAADPFDVSGFGLDEAAPVAALPANAASAASSPVTNSDDIFSSTFDFVPPAASQAPVLQAPVAEKPAEDNWWESLDDISPEKK
jgi:phosphoglycolate/pyridoxal phosphate phosphatase family enzyme